LDCGELDPETCDVVHKLEISYLNSSKTGCEQKPVFGVRELEESHFILNPSTIQQTQDEIIDFMKNQSSDGKLKNNKPKPNRSRHNSATPGIHRDPVNKEEHVTSSSEIYVSLPEIPKGLILSKI